MEFKVPTKGKFAKDLCGECGDTGTVVRANKEGREYAAHCTCAKGQAFSERPLYAPQGKSGEREKFELPKVKPLPPRSGRDKASGDS